MQPSWMANTSYGILSVDDAFVFSVIGRAISMWVQEIFLLEKAKFAAWIDEYDFWTVLWYFIRNPKTCNA